MSTTWNRYVDRVPTMADADYRCDLWISGVAENTGTRIVGLMPYAKAVQMLESGAADYWADTGMRMPEPPEEALS